MKNRKTLPRFGRLSSMKVDVDSVVQHLASEGLLDWNIYDDIKVSSNSKHKNFVISNSFSKDQFFKEQQAESLEGDQYVQLYLTDLKPEIKEEHFSAATFKNSTIFSRTKRLDPTRSNYVAEADELNYGERNEHVKGVLENILDMFSDKITRVRLAALKPGFEIKPHVDYDPSYIARYHIPLITNQDVKMYIQRGDNVAEYAMPSDGGVYFFNSGLKHWVKNNSDETRLHLIIDVHGQKDLEYVEDIIF